MKCPDCDVDCVQYREYKTIGECPECKKLLTTASGDDVQLYSVRLEKKLKYECECNKCGFVWDSEYENDECPECESTDVWVEKNG